MDFAHYTNLVRDFVAHYPNWAAAVVFALAFGESLAFVSLVLPFWAMLVAIGAIIGGTNSSQLLDHRRGGRLGRRARRLALLLARLPLSTSASRPCGRSRTIQR